MHFHLHGSILPSRFNIIIKDATLDSAEEKILQFRGECSIFGQCPASANVVMVVLVVVVVVVVASLLHRRAMKKGRISHYEWTAAGRFSRVEGLK